MEDGCHDSLSKMFGTTGGQVGYSHGKVDYYVRRDHCPVMPKEP